MGHGLKFVLSCHNDYDVLNDEAGQGAMCAQSYQIVTNNGLTFPLVHYGLPGRFREGFLKSDQSLSDHIYGNILMTE